MRLGPPQPQCPKPDYVLNAGGSGTAPVGSLRHADRQGVAGLSGRVEDFLRYSDRIGGCRLSSVERHVTDHFPDLILHNPVVQCSPLSARSTDPCDTEHDFKLGTRFRFCCSRPVGRQSPLARPSRDRRKPLTNQGELIATEVVVRVQLPSAALGLRVRQTTFSSAPSGPT